MFVDVVGCPHFSRDESGRVGGRQEVGGTVR